MSLKILNEYWQYWICHCGDTHAPTLPYCPKCGRPKNFKTGRKIMVLQEIVFYNESPGSIQQVATNPKDSQFAGIVTKGTSFMASKATKPSLQEIHKKALPESKSAPETKPEVKPKRKPGRPKGKAKDKNLR